MYLNNYYIMAMLEIQSAARRVCRKWNAGHFCSSYSRSHLYVLCSMIYWIHIVSSHRWLQKGDFRIFRRKILHIVRFRKVAFKYCVHAWWSSCNGRIMDTEWEFKTPECNPSSTFYSCSKYSHSKRNYVREHCIYIRLNSTRLYSRYQMCIP